MRLAIRAGSGVEQRCRIENESLVEYEPQAGRMNVPTANMVPKAAAVPAIFLATILAGVLLMTPWIPITEPPTAAPITKPIEAILALRHARSCQLG